ncbi:hypothetical protein SDC9_185945 [bioreactor metagenome]|uniref:Uncharacterized protein n=1 Tax=bioreactor metagenome TaxID=1076179 RepID=A0A645HHC1_9ZZZZ
MSSSGHGKILVLFREKKYGLLYANQIAQKNFGRFLDLQHRTSVFYILGRGAVVDVFAQIIPAALLDRLEQGQQRMPGPAQLRFDKIGVEFFYFCRPGYFIRRFLGNTAHFSLHLSQNDLDIKPALIPHPVVEDLAHFRGAPAVFIKFVIDDMGHYSSFPSRRSAPLSFFIGDGFDFH